MRNFININKLLFLIFFCFAFNDEIFAKNSSKKSGLNNDKKIKVSKQKASAKSHKKLQKSAKKSSRINKKFYKKLDDDYGDIDDNFDYESLYKNEVDDDSKLEPEDDNNQNNQNELSDFGIIKDTVGEKKIIKKYDSEEDEIFLNKDIFDEKNKGKLRKSQEPEPQIEDKKFKISNRIVSDLSFTDNFSGRNNKFYDTSGVVRYFSSIQLNKNFEFYGLFRFARFDNDNDIAKRRQSPSGGGSRTFENMGIAISEISVKYSKNNNSLILGKFTANFGTAWRWNKAIMIHSVPQDYALTEKLGITGITKYGDIKKTGLYNFSLSFFTNDRKNFDNSLLHRKNSDSKSQALAGDTRSLASYAFATDVSFDFSEREKLRYHIGYSKLAVNTRRSQFPRDRIKKQQGIVFGMNYEFPINKNFSGETILEHADIKNPNGNADVINNYLTTNFILKYQTKYSLMIGNSRNRNKNFSSGNSNINISEINLGYEFSKNTFFDKLTTQVGYYQKIEKSAENSIKNKSLAILIRYYKNF